MMTHSMYLAVSEEDVLLVASDIVKIVIRNARMIIAEDEQR